jgi:hypothetical protein
MEKREKSTLFSLTWIMGANSFFLDKHARIGEGKQEENFLLVE